MTESKSRLSALHSRYNPQKEAHRYVEELRLDNSSGIFLCLEPGLGYLCEELKNRYPAGRVIELHCDSETLEERISSTEAAWAPDAALSMEKFLSTHISDFDLGNIHIIEWPPSKRVFGRKYQTLLKNLSSFLQRRRANVHTIGTFGRLWLFNSIKRILYSNSFIHPSEESRPICIAASGPRLQQSLPFLKKLEKGASIWALPSSIPALRDAGIHIDLIVHTDPGFYASYHLRDSKSIEQDHALPLFSYFDKRHGGSSLLLNTQSATENFFIKALDLPYIEAISHGTVAGTALTAALHLTEGAIFIAGLDLEYQDIRGHVVPHSFDALLLEQNSRTLPLIQLYYQRSPRASKEGGASDSPLQNYALQRYSEWFEALPSHENGRIYRLFPSGVSIPAFETINSGDQIDRSIAALSEEKSIETRRELRIPEKRERIEAVHSYLEAIRGERDSFFHDLEEGDFIGALDARPLLREFLTYCAYSDLFRLYKESIQNRTVSPQGERSFREKIQYTIDSIDQLVKERQKV